MKKLMILSVTVITMLSILLVGCQSGPPKPPVSKLLDLDELVVDNMTIDEVYALLKPELRQTSTLYQAANLKLAADGDWEVTSKQYGYAEGEEGPYQVLFFPPDESGEDSYLIFFKEKVVMGKAWFIPKTAAIFKAILQGLYK